MKVLSIRYFMLILVLVGSVGLIFLTLSACTPVSEIMITPTPTSMPEPSPTPSHEPPMVEILSPTPDTEFDEGEIITVTGTHNLNPQDHVWIFLRDNFRNYYLQNPSVELLADGTWEATNIRVGKEIRYVLVVFVSPEGNQVIQAWVEAGSYGAKSEENIQSLPGYLELARVKIITPGP